MTIDVDWDIKNQTEQITMPFLLLNTKLTVLRIDNSNRVDFTQNVLIPNHMDTSLY